MNTIDQQIQDETLKRLADASCEWTLLETGPAYFGIQNRTLQLLLSSDAIIIGIGEIGCELERHAHQQLASAILAKYDDVANIQKTSAKQAILTALTQ